MNSIEVVHKEYECADGCCYEDWFELIVNGKTITYTDEYGYEHPRRYMDMPYDIAEIVSDITGINYVSKGGE